MVAFCSQMLSITCVNIRIVRVYPARWFRCVLPLRSPSLIVVEAIVCPAVLLLNLIMLSVIVVHPIVHNAAVLIVPHFWFLRVFFFFFPRHSRSRRWYLRWFYAFPLSLCYTKCFLLFRVQFFFVLILLGLFSLKPYCCLQTLGCLIYSRSLSHSSTSDS